MKNKSDTTIRMNSSGHTLWELLMTLSIASLITVSGIGVLQDLLRIQRQAEVLSVDEQTHQKWFSSLQSAIDGRYMNPFSNEPWLTIRTEEGTHWFPLQQIEIQVVEAGNVRQWTWDSPEQVSVLSNRSSGEFFHGEMPGSLVFQFPESEISRFREGIAIEGI